MAAGGKELFTNLFAFVILQYLLIKLTGPMKVNRNQYRAIYAALLIIAFFIPAYDDVSAFQFSLLVLRSAGADNEITLLDLLVILLPLLLILLTAMLILFKAVNKRPLNSLLLCLPFFSIAVFFLLLLFDINRQIDGTSLLNLLTQMHIGFYVAGFASLLLLFSYSRRESLNLGTGSF
jgi:hypothetical protein